MCTKILQERILLNTRGHDFGFNIYLSNTMRIWTHFFNRTILLQKL